MREWDDEQKRKTIRASFTAYQVIAHLGGFGETIPRFDRYLHNIGVEVE